MWQERREATPSIVKRLLDEASRLADPAKGRKIGEAVASRGGRPLGSGRQLPPQLTVGRRPLGGGGGGGGGGALEGGV